MKDAEQLVRFAARQAEKLFKRQGVIHPLYHYVRADGEQGVFAPPPWCKSKDQMVALAKSVFKAEEAIAYVFLNEIWQLRLRAGVDVAIERFGGTLENAPGRTEHIMMAGEDERGMVMGTMQIHRPGNGSAFLGKLKIDRPADMEGRMVGLLPARGSKQ